LKIKNKKHLYTNKPVDITIFFLCYIYNTKGIHNTFSQTHLNPF
jgi:hypothetical protein